MKWSNINSEVVGRTVEYNLCNAPRILNGIPQPFVHDLVNIAEDTMIDCRLSQTMFTDYYNRAVADFLRARRVEPEGSNLIGCWCDVALWKQGGTALKVVDELVPAFKILMELTNWIRVQVKMGYNGTNSRIDEYTHAFGEVWNELEKLRLAKEAAAEAAREKLENERQLAELQKEAVAGHTTGKQVKLEPKPNEPKDEPEMGDAKGESDGGKDVKPEPDGPKGQAPVESTPPDDESQDDGTPNANSGDLQPTRNPGTPDDLDDPMASPVEDEDNGLDTSAALSMEPIKPGTFRSPKIMQPIDVKLMEAVEDAIEKEVEDPTEELKAMMVEEGLDADMVHHTLRRREKDSQFVQPNQDLVNRLGNILKIDLHLKTRDLHGEMNGKLDKRHLGRSQSDGKIFKKQTKLPGNMPPTAIVLDVSGSVDRTMREEMAQAAAALSTLLGSQVWGYAEHGHVDLGRCDEQRKIRIPTGSGNTPSANALIGVGEQLPKGSLIIHLTDGEANSGFPMEYAEKVLRAKKIETVHILWTRHDSQYQGLTYKVIDGIGEFPDALFDILLDKLRLKLNGRH
jgi:hypothetical protein